ncbi:glycosyltransferase [Salibacterium aidingense]|uniref:glycosyltransferase n=1 Tax=Salibacterium aidingense TaxID=384933 RepID=UPI003BBDB183
MRTKVCFLLNSLSFLDERVFEKEGKSLVKQGYEVTIIAPKIKGALFDVNGSPFSNRFQKEVFIHQNITIKTYEYTHKVDPAAAHPLYLTGLKERADIYHAHELQSFHIGKEIKRTLRTGENKMTKLLYDSRWVDPDPYSDTPKESIRQRDMMLLESLKEVDYIISTSESMKAWYLSKYPRIPVEVIYDSPPLVSSYHLKGRESKTFTAAFTGAPSKENREMIVSCMRKGREDIDLRFKVIGGGSQVFVPDQLSPYITMTDLLPYDSLPKTLADVDTGFINMDSSRSLHDSFALPSSFFTYLNNAVPVVVSKCHEMEHFIRTYHCGIVINKQKPKPEDYVDGFLYLYRHKNKAREMSWNARKVMEDHFNWSYMEKRLLKVYNSMRGDKPGYLMT